MANAVFRYYTGTGNTARAVQVLARELTAAGWTVDRAEVAVGGAVPTLDELSEHPLLVLACPTLGFSAPRHFLTWVRRLPRLTGAARGCPAAVVVLCGATWSRRGPVPGHPGVCQTQLVGLLRRRGYRVVSISEHSYPENWTQMAPPPAEAACQSIREQADAALVALARAWVTQPEVTTGSAHRGVAWLWPVALAFLAFASRFLGKLYVADASCTGCGLCVERCPARTMALRQGRPRWGLECDACNRCINLCPSRSIQVSAVRLVVHGGGNLVLFVVALSVLPPLFALGAWLAGSAIQLFAVEFALRRLEALPALTSVMTWSWSKRWPRYRDPGFR